jgi:hypothetical protein
LRIADCGFNRKEHNAAKPQPKEFTTDYTDYTDRKEKKKSDSRNQQFFIRVIRVIRGKIFAKLGDSDGLQRKERREGVSLCAPCVLCG